MSKKSNINPMHQELCDAVWSKQYHKMHDVLKKYIPDIDQVKSDGILIKWADDRSTLNSALNNGLPSLYKTCFSEHPYYEEYSDEDVNNIFNTYFEQKSSILLLFNENKETIGFSVKTPINDPKKIIKTDIKNIKSENNYFFGSDLGIEPRYRCKGLSLALEHLQTGRLTHSFTHEITRTSASNYKRIAGNLKSGKQRLPYKEEITMKRTNGTISTDERIYFERCLKNNESPDLFLEKVVIASPGGNDTAIVFDQVKRDQQGELSKLIQKNYPGVEQVMFAEEKNSAYFGQMAGGEFCGNATRSLAYVLHKQGKLNSNKIHVSGTSVPLKVKVDGNFSQASMPITNNIEEINDGVQIVHLEGISFLVIEENSNEFKELSNFDTIDEKKSYVTKTLSRFCLDTKLASGVLALKRSESNIYMDPYVYVRDTQTLYYETACGSGTTAIGMIEAKRKKESIKNMMITQPSGRPIAVSVDYKDMSLFNASINGPVDILFDGSMPLVKDRSRKPKLTPI